MVRSRHEQQWKARLRPRATADGRSDAGHGGHNWRHGETVGTADDKHAWWEGRGEEKGRIVAREKVGNREIRVKI